MEIESVIREKKEIYSSLMEFIEATENADFELLIKDFESHVNFKNKEEIKSILQLISKISDNHHRLPDFIDKLNQIIQNLLKEIRPPITDFEIYKIFKYNKRVLLLLLEQEFIRPDNIIISDIMKMKDRNNFPYSRYLYSGIKSFINENESRAIESEIKQKYDQDLNIFEEKCRIGENDSYICSLIRQGLTEEFISYVKRNKISLSSKIQPSIFETNLFLMQKTPTLIEYASIFGSIEIIKYLQHNYISLTNSMWLYAVHSNNALLNSLMNSFIF
ncbi:hypothetical protein M9Y10_024735 [Tritrichomonas musculus]|uniref:DUF3447 domain-containing protein n=1 Tax=Tritrichomonas musculus TaxID=1915356 RepID=A0ABR2HB42_9EUKA